MSSWSKKRKFTYGGIVASLIIIVVGTLGWKIFYRAPTCYDGEQNGKEQGIDCGGMCTKLCPDAFVPPINSWTKFEKISDGVYNVASYLINPNLRGEAFKTPYQVEIYDRKGMLIAAFNDYFTLPPNRNTVAFHSGVRTQEAEPAKAVFKMMAVPEWHLSDDRVKTITIVDKSYSENERGSSLTVTLKNSGVEPVSRFSLYVILYDQEANAIGFSKTVIDGMQANSIKLAPFTWPVNRNGKVISIEVLPVAE